jgi:hypothetical protein
MSANGRLLDRELTMVGGVPLAHLAAEAFIAMDRDCRAQTGVGLWIAKPYGGYRSLEVQKAGLTGLNKNSTIVVASVGLSSHGLGTRADIGSMPPARDLDLYGKDGRKRREWLLANASNYGWTREFGEADHNHFKFDGINRNFDNATPDQEEELNVDIPLDGGPQPFQAVAKDIFMRSNESAAILKSIENINHNGIDAPLEVVVADTRVIVGNISNALAGMALQLEPAKQAAALAPLLAPLLESHADSLPTADLEQIAARVDQLLAKRLAD